MSSPPIPQPKMGPASGSAKPPPIHVPDRRAGAIDRTSPVAANPLTPLYTPRKRSFARAQQQDFHPVMMGGADPPPNRFELFLLGEGEKKVTWRYDTRVPNTSIFTFNKEDHTLGNLLASRLHKYNYVTFSGYIVGHPLIPAFDLRVSTDGTVTPKDSVINCCKDLVHELSQLSREFDKEMELKKIAKSFNKD